MKKILLFSIVLLGLSSIANAETKNLISPVVNDLEPSEEWQVYNIFDGIKVEYRMATCGDGVEMREQHLLLFRFTNTTSENKSIFWRTEMWRDGECYNCHRIERDEYAHELELGPNEIISGECSFETIRDQALYIHDNYIKHVPGMANTRLTNFELIDVTVR